MSSSLVITAADTSGRWYLLPGAANSYELTIANESAHAVLCKLSLDEPADAGSVVPSSVTLKAGESRTVSVSFKPEWLSLRDRKAVISARDATGSVVATFVHDLVAATTTDCSVSLAWKDEIAGDGMLRGFMLTCTVRSISSTPGVFEPDFVPHPSLRFPEPHRLTLGPGEMSTFDVPVIWNRSARDNEGWNHPRTIEVGVGVTHGRRTASAPWDLVQQHIEPYLTDADRAPVIVRRPPPPQFSQPGGVATAAVVSPLVAPPMPEPVMAPANESHAERVARAEMEAGVAASGLRLPAQPVVHQQPEAQRETIAVAPGTLLLIAIAVGAIAIALVWMLRVPPSTSAVSTAPVQVASPALPAAESMIHRKSPARKVAKPKHTAAPSAAATAAVAAEAAAATAAPAPVAAGSTAHAATAQPSSRAHVAAVTPQRNSPVDRSALVQLGGVGAEYLRGGRQLHVYWDSYAQARAEVQVLDARDTLLAETTVGRRMAAVVSLPRGYRQGVYVQVTAIGYDGTRVVSTTSLGPP